MKKYDIYHLKWKLTLEKKEKIVQMCRDKIETTFKELFKLQSELKRRVRTISADPLFTDILLQKQQI